MGQDVFSNSTYRSTFFGKSKSEGGFKIDKKFKEDDKKVNSHISKNSVNNNTEEPKKRIGKKAIRKIIRQLNENISSEEMELMIWVIFIKYNIRI